MFDLSTFTAWLVHPEIRAIVIGLVIAWCGTQFVKPAPWLSRKSDHVRRWWIRALAFVLGFLPTFLLWPRVPGTPAIEAAVYASAVGISAPFAYIIAARILYHFFPWLEPKMSSGTKAAP